MSMVEKRGDVSTDARVRIDAYLESSGLALRQPTVVPLTGDASDRRYFRVLLDGAGSVVLALHAGPIAFATLPFANVAELLNRMGVAVPAVHGHSDELGIIELDDLGDLTLQAHVGAASVTAHAALYRDAVAIIARMQQRSRDFASPSFVPYTLAFDVEKLTWELDFFVTHFLAGYRGVSLTTAERDALGEEWRAIAGELAAEPRVVCHRDYHSRNLMLHDGRLYVIDFQDARLGPDTYDLVSLLRDSYVDITERERDDLMAYFLALAGISDTAAFARRFDLMAVQRNLKALGTFGFQATARGNPAYIHYMPRTLHYVQASLAAHNRFGRLRALLGAHLRELG
jgi:aminoglycoside/choline kinase family phosphotransferase